MNDTTRIHDMGSPTSPPRITRQQLEALIKDPSVPVSALKPYFVGAPERTKGTAPGIKLNPALIIAPPDDISVQADTALSWLNGICRARRQDQFNDRIENGDPRKVIVAEGDSWFLFPVDVMDVVEHLFEHFNVLSLGAAGDTLEEIAVSDDFMIGLEEQRGRVKAFLFSAGGNDIIGEDKADNVAVIRKVVSPFNPGFEARDYIDNAAWRSRLASVRQQYRGVLATVRARFPELPIICNSYDYAIPWSSGDPRDPCWADKDEWLGDPLSDLGITNTTLQRAIIREMLDQFTAMLNEFCGGNSPHGEFRRVWNANILGTVGNLWVDEVHPTTTGFKLVANRYRTLLRSIL